MLYEISLQTYNEYKNRIIPGDFSSKIQVIKDIRVATDCSLVAAKILVDKMIGTYVPNLTDRYDVRFHKNKVLFGDRQDFEEKAFAHFSNPELCRHVLLSMFNSGVELETEITENGWKIFYYSTEYNHYIVSEAVKNFSGEFGPISLPN